MSDAPWEVLGLDPRNITLRELRRAYARLVKQHRPDRDPEGFRRIQEAYEFLRSLLERGGPSGETAISFVPSDAPEDGEAREAPAAESGPVPTAGAAPAASDIPSTRHAAEPSPLTALMREIRAARKAGDVENGRRLLARALAAWKSEPALTESLAELVAELASESPETVLTVVGPEDCMAEVRAGGTRMTAALLELWASRGQWDDVHSFGGWLLANVDNLPPEAAAPAMAAAAWQLAIAHPERARKLADGAYRLAPPVVRGHLLDGLELPLMAGAQMGSMLTGTRRTIARCVASGKADLADKAVAEAFRDLWYLGNSQLAQDFVFGRLPEVRIKTRPKGGGAAARARRVGQKKRFVLSEGRSYWWVGLVLLMCVHLVRMCSNSSISPVPAHVPGPGAGVPTGLNGLKPEDMERIRRMLQERRDPGLPLDIFENRYSGPLPDVYKDIPWMEPVRRRLSGTEEDVRKRTRILVRTFAKDPRYRTMLKTLSQDDTLPKSARAEVERALKALGPEPEAVPSLESPAPDPPPESAPAPVPVSPPSAS